MKSKSWFWAGSGAILLALPVVAWLTARAHSANRLGGQHYGKLPEFSLLDQLGRQLKKSDLDGKVWIANFIFTGCSEACPRLSQEMSKIQRFVQNRGFDGKARLISFSVDPGRDTPEKLAAYASGFDANPEIWRFLTGPQADIEKAVVQGFKSGIERAKNDFDIVHGTYLALVDASGEIRGYYDAHDFRRMSDLRLDLSALVEHGGK